MKQNKNIRISSWIFAIVYLISGVLIFILIPSFAKIFREAGLSIPSLSHVVFSVKPLIWLIIACILAILSILRDINTKMALFSNWIAALILLVAYFVLVIPLFLPMFFEVSKYNK